MSFNDITGHAKTLSIIRKQVNQNKVPHAYLFVGPSGVGKKKTAVELAKSLNCIGSAKAPNGIDGESRRAGDSCGECLSCRKIENAVHPDVTLIDFFWQAELLQEKPEKQTQIKIDTVREIQKTVSLKPFEGRWKVFILDDVQKISGEAANCLLKTLEEPPRNTLLILLSSVKGTLPQTVVSRCQCLRFGYLTDDEILKVVAVKSCPGETDGAGFRELIKFARGSAGEMLSLVESGAGDSLRGLVSLWERLRTGGAGIREILQFIDGTGTDRKSADDLISKLIVLAHNEIESGQPLCEILEALLQCRGAIRYNVTPELIIDVALLKIKNWRKNYAGNC
ncbi:MAG: hypothetical protein ABIJ11_06995 [Elusimicrobiota bacterium]